MSKFHEHMNQFSPPQSPSSSSLHQASRLPDRPSSIEVLAEEVPSPLLGCQSLSLSSQWWHCSWRTSGWWWLEQLRTKKHVFARVLPGQISLTKSGFFYKSEFRTFIIHDLGIDGLGGISIPNLVHSFDAKLVLLVLWQVLDGSTTLCEDLAVCNIKLIAVRPHLLNIVASDWAATVGARWLPSKGDGSLGSFSVVQLFGSRGSTWNIMEEFSQHLRIVTMRSNKPSMLFLWYIF